MMGIGRCKDLDEWLVGSGESAETADSNAAKQRAGLRQQVANNVLPTRNASSFEPMASSGADGADEGP